MDYIIGLPFLLNVCNLSLLVHCLLVVSLVLNSDLGYYKCCLRVHLI